MSVVTEEALNTALIAYHRTRPHEGVVVAMRAALAAVAPLIAAQERERCARVLDARVMGDCNREDQEAKRCAAAIRALSDATDTAPAPTRNAGHLENAASPRPR